MTKLFHRKAATALLIAASCIGLAGCTSPGVPLNKSLESIHQPVVQRTNYTFDLASGPGGIAPSEQRRLSGWFEAMDLRYGDRISIDDPVNSNAARTTVEAIASRYSMLVSDDAPTTPGYVNAGTVRVVVSRSTASVKGCPDWGTKTDTNMHNATASGYGCAVNGNFSAMIANPEDLIRGNKGPSQTTVMSSTKAIETYRGAEPTGGGGKTLKSNSTKSGE